jgi:hypothetical protein
MHVPFGLASPPRDVVTSSANAVYGASLLSSSWR